MNKNNYWPFVLLMPSSIGERIRFLQTLFSSTVVVEVLTIFDDQEEVCQKEVVSRLKHHSNKTVISVLKRLTELGLLTEVQRSIRSGSRVVRVKCYRLTDIGRWYSIFFKDVSIFDRDTIAKVLVELLSIFVNKIAVLRERLGLSFREFAGIVIPQLISGLMKSETHRVYDVAIFGSMALDIYLGKDLKVFPGGSGANVASNCAQLGLSTVFVSRIPGDILGVKLALELVDEGVDISFSQLDLEARTPICAIRDWYTDNPEITCSYDKNRPPVLTEVDNNIIALCNQVKAIYLGEGVCKMYRELLKSISRENKLVIYRPSVESLESYLDECLSILEYNPIVILNERKHSILRRKGILVPVDLAKLGAETIIITRGSKGVLVYTYGKELSIPSPEHLDVVDTVGAGDLFVAILIQSLVQGLDIEEAVRRATEKASQEVSTLGPRKLRVKLSS